MNVVEQFVDIVSQKNEFSRKYLQKWNIDEKEKRELEIILNFFQREYGYSIEFLADTYLFINNMVMEETYYFVLNGSYRNSTFEAVNGIVYQSEDYMTKYMCGLSISDYIWINHIKMLRYFEEHLSEFYGSSYLEIGPGFGLYLIKAVMSHNFESYLACDISATSVERCKAYLGYRGISDVCNVIEKDFFEFTSEDKFDCIVMGEVLEHVEKPLDMLKQICSLLSENGKAFVTTVINAPMIDHIYLFDTVESVLDMAKRAGFCVRDYICATAGDISLEKAQKKKKAINIAMILEKEN